MNINLSAARITTYSAFVLSISGLFLIGTEVNLLGVYISMFIAGLCSSCVWNENNTLRRVSIHILALVISFGVFPQSIDSEFIPAIPIVYSIAVFFASENIRRFPVFVFLALSIGVSVFIKTGFVNIILLVILNLILLTALYKISSLNFDCRKAVRVYYFPILSLLIFSSIFIFSYSFVVATISVLFFIPVLIVNN